MHGSIRLAQAWRDRSGVHAVIDLEMIAYTARRQALPRGIRARRHGDFLAVVANEPSAFIGQAFITAARRHLPYWEQGFPAVMVTDTAFLRNPNYHSPTDTLDTLDLEYLLRVCELCAETAADLAGG